MELPNKIYYFHVIGLYVISSSYYTIFLYFIELFTILNNYAALRLFSHVSVCMSVDYITLEWLNIHSSIVQKNA